MATQWQHLGAIMHATFIRTLEKFPGRREFVASLGVDGRVNKVLQRYPYFNKGCQYDINQTALHYCRQVKVHPNWGMNGPENFDECSSKGRGKIWSCLRRDQRGLVQRETIIRCTIAMNGNCQFSAVATRQGGRPALTLQSADDRRIPIISIRFDIWRMSERMDIIGILQIVASVQGGHWEVNPERIVTRWTCSPGIWSGDP
ncbi:hypothetical protein Bbelb_425410 [Branchiostoma belcheri]|nr:hypothetical protein Bbelb_425410 [Branchiostoma belcheri]